MYNGAGGILEFSDIVYKTIVMHGIYILRQKITLIWIYNFQF